MAKKVILYERDGVVGKECTKCGEWKELESGYHAKKDGTGGRTPACKDCIRMDQAIYKQRNKEKLSNKNREWYQRNKEKVKDYGWKWKMENKEKKKETDEKWRNQNKERVKENQSNYRRLNKNKILDYGRDWYEKNKERKQLLAKIWNASNPEKRRTYVQRRLARKSGLPDTLTSEEYTETLEHFGNACALSGETENIEQEHAIPLSIGRGGTTFENCYPMTKRLNISKFNSNIFEWFGANRQRFELSQERFDNLIAWLASANAMTVEEYRDYVYWCHANPRSIDELTDDKEVI